MGLFSILDLSRNIFRRNCLGFFIAFITDFCCLIVVSTQSFIYNYDFFPRKNECMHNGGVLADFMEFDLLSLFFLSCFFLLLLFKSDLLLFSLNC